MTRKELFDMDKTKKCEALLIIGEVDKGKYVAIVIYKRLDEVFFEDGVPYKGEPVFPNNIAVYTINSTLSIVDTTSIFGYDKILQVYRENGHSPILLKGIDDTNEEIISLEEEYEQLNVKKIEIQNLKEKKQQIFSIYDNNNKISNKLENTSKNLIENMKKFSIYEELYKLSSGNISGKRRISFEQYVQATYFDMVLYEANKRFQNMTDGRFKLLRKEIADNLSSKFALDLDVYDEYNGSKRDVKSLSGGESFKAALSLALGLSDIIQSYSGGVVIDTLFIDEGFGSLDTESREQAINTLNSLIDSNKLIGIISHVTELKERIDKKIVINKTADGSKIEIEV